VNLNPPDANLQRAAATYAAMQRWLYADRGSLYSETSPATGNPYAFVWPFSRALYGTLALAGADSSAREQVADRLVGLEWYWDGRAYASYVLFPYGSGGDRYTDDNAWVGLALIQAHRMRLSHKHDRPEKVLAYAESQWDRRLGGLFWVQQNSAVGRTNHDRGAGATAGHAQLGFHLYELTGSDRYLKGADRMLDWVRRTFDSSGTGSGPFWNALRSDGSIDTNLWSYNQGVMIGAYVMAYRLKQEPGLLQVAEAIARQTLGTFGDFTGQPPSFNAMCFQHFLMLHASTSDAALQARMLHVMHQYADWTWESSTGARDPQTDLFSFDDAGRPACGRQAARLQDQGAQLQLYSLLAWNPSDYQYLT
jgi:hypothetical protein